MSAGGLMAEGRDTSMKNEGFSLLLVTMKLCTAKLVK
jgi:hypothetical protein